jgi:transposase
LAEVESETLEDLHLAQSYLVKLVQAIACGRQVSPSLSVVAASPDPAAGEHSIQVAAIGQGDEVLGSAQGKDGSEDAGRSQRELSGAGDWRESANLSKWLRDAGSLQPVKRRVQDEPAKTEVRRPDDWSAEDKLEAVLEAKRLSGSELGEFLRQRGLHEEQLRQWESAAVDSLRGRKASGKSAESKRVKELERELRRKEKALAEAAALLVLRKKAEALWGDEDAQIG